MYSMYLYSECYFYDSPLLCATRSIWNEMNIYSIKFHLTINERERPSNNNDDKMKYILADDGKSRFVFFFFSLFFFLVLWMVSIYLAIKELLPIIYIYVREGYIKKKGRKFIAKIFFAKGTWNESFKSDYIDFALKKQNNNNKIKSRDIHASIMTTI